MTLPRFVSSVGILLVLAPVLSLTGCGKSTSVDPPVVADAADAKPTTTQAESTEPASSPRETPGTSTESQAGAAAPTPKSPAASPSPKATAPADTPTRPKATLAPATAREAIKHLNLKEVAKLEIDDSRSSSSSATNLSYSSLANHESLCAHHGNQLQALGWNKLPPNPAYDAAKDLTVDLFEKEGFYLKFLVNSGYPGMATVDLQHLGNVDARALPPFPGAQEHASSQPDGATYVTAKPTAEVVDYCRQEMLKAGWHEFVYTGIPSPMALDTATSKNVAFKKNAVCCYLSVNSHPSFEDGKTAISYHIIGILDRDIPTVADAADIRLEQNRFQLDYTTKMPVDKVTQFYRDMYGQLGWEERTKDGSVQGDFARLLFVDSDDLGFMVDIDAAEAGNTEVDIGLVSFAETPSDDATAEDSVATTDPPTSMPNVVPDLSVVDDLAKMLDNLPAEARGQVEAELEKMRSALQAATAGDESEVVADEVEKEVVADEAEMEVVADEAAKEVLAMPQRGILAAQVPVPEGAKDVERAADVEMITYRSEWNATKVADFYRQELKKLGWTEVADETFIDEEIGVGGLTFSKDDTSFRVAIQDGQSASKTRMVILGDALVWSASEDAGAVEMEEAFPRPDTLLATESTPAEDEADGAADLENHCEIHLGDDTHKLDNFIAYKTVEFDEPVTVLLISEKPVSEAKLGRMIKKEDFSVFDLFGFEIPKYLQLTLSDDYTMVNCFIDGSSISLGSSDIQSTARVKNGRLQGRIRLEEPHEVFDKPFRFEVTVDAKTLSPSHTAPDPNSPEMLVLDDSYELPVPEGASDVYQEGSQFRRSVKAQLDVSVADLLALYRREMPSHGWKEVPDRYTQSDTDTALVFQGPEGELFVRLKRKGEDATVQIVARYTKQAEAAGILPRPGKARLILGNAHTKQVVVAINGNEHRIAAGAGAENPKDGKSLDLDKGKYTAVIRIPGEKDETEKLTLEEGETWGIIVIPTGGYFFDQLY